jgi:LytS/YehU family sensor histidine kinase
MAWLGVLGEIRTLISHEHAVAIMYSIFLIMSHKVPIVSDQSLCNAKVWRVDYCR